MEESEETENTMVLVEDTPMVAQSDVAKQPAKHLMEVDLTSNIYDKNLDKADADVQLQTTYMCTLPGFLRILQVLMSVGALICVTSTSFNGDSYLLLPAAWRFRVFVFTSVVSILIAFLLLVIHASTISRMMAIDWLSLEIVISGVMTLLYLISTAMVGSAYREFSGKNKVWTDRSILLAGMIIGFICFGLYGLHVTTLLRRRRKHGLFRHQSLQLERTGSVIS
ncbi:uncharacterized protein [Antedon mediterranea]|uniref:uncharacterized protein n=1 Tax=Antedon mediterranea TaxID=105859 RepID=UPI003AF53CD9